MPLFRYALDVNRREWRTPLDQIGGFFGDHDHCCVYVSADQIGHDRGISNAQTIDANHFECGIDDRQRIVLAGPLQVPSGW